jgi:hypothetical protein
MSDRTDQLELLVNGCEACGENPKFINNKGKQSDMCEECLMNTCPKCGDEMGRFGCAECGIQTDTFDINDCV